MSLYINTSRRCLCHSSSVDAAARLPPGKKCDKSMGAAGAAAGGGATPSAAAPADAVGLFKSNTAAWVAGGAASAAGAGRVVAGGEVGGAEREMCRGGTGRICAV